MDYIICSSQQVFESSADTQLFLLGEKQGNFLVSFEGYLNSTTDSLLNFRCSEVIIYRGSTVLRIIETIKKRSENEIANDDSLYRKIELKDELKLNVVDWLFSAQQLTMM